VTTTTVIPTTTTQPPAVSTCFGVTACTGDCHLLNVTYHDANSCVITHMPANGYGNDERISLQLLAENLTLEVLFLNSEDDYDRLHIGPCTQYCDNEDISMPAHWKSFSGKHTNYGDYDLNSVITAENNEVHWITDESVTFEGFQIRISTISAAGETTTTEVPVEVTTTTEMPMEVTTTTEVPVEVTTTTGVPVEVTTTTQQPAASCLGVESCTGDCHLLNVTQESAMSCLLTHKRPNHNANRHMASTRKAKP
jgi:hypothetical protein